MQTVIDWTIPICIRGFPYTHRDCCDDPHEDSHVHDPPNTRMHMGSLYAYGNLRLHIGIPICIRGCSVCKLGDKEGDCKGNVEAPRTSLSPSVNLEIAQPERSVLLEDDKRLLKESNEVDSLGDQIGNYEHLKLIFIGLKCMCILPGSPKR
jgi:hypothetical protein